MARRTPPFHPPAPAPVTRSRISQALVGVLCVGLTILVVSSALIPHAA